MSSAGIKNNKIKLCCGLLKNPLFSVHKHKGMAHLKVKNVSPLLKVRFYKPVYEPGFNFVSHFVTRKQSPQISSYR